MNIKTFSYNRVGEEIMEPKNNGVEHRSLEERATEFDGQLNLDGEFDWPPTVGRKRWDEYDNEAPTQMNK